MTKQQKKIDEDALVGLSRTELDAHLAETTASDSLKSYPHGNKSNDAAVKRALEVMSALEPHQKQAVADELAKSLRSHEGGDGVPDGTAEKSRKSLKSAQAKKDMSKLKKELFSMFDGEGLTEEFKEHASEIFYNAVETVSIRNRLIEMFRDNPELNLLLMSEEQIDAVDMLAKRIEWLEEQIAAVELDNARLRSLAEREALAEEVLYDAPRSVNRRRSLGENFSSVNEDTLIIDENGKVTGSDTSFTSQNQHVSNPAMRTYVEALNRTTRNVDRHTAKENLVEAWKVGG
jgi:hypothetical protein